jgi:magnesium transporter
MSQAHEPPIRRRIPVVVLPSALEAFVPLWRAAALALAEIGPPLFFVMGDLTARVDGWALPAVLVAWLIGVYVRQIDIESWALLVPGGLVGRADRAVGPAAARLAAAVLLVERVVFAALVAVLIGQYVSTAVGVERIAVVTTAVSERVPSLGGRLETSELATLIAAVLVGSLWLRNRLGHQADLARLARGVWLGAGIVAVAVVWVTAVLTGRGPQVVTAIAAPLAPTSALDAILRGALALALALPVLGSGDAVSRLAHEFPAPRVGTLRRTSRLVMVLSGAGLIALTLGYEVLVPGGMRQASASLLVLIGQLPAAPGIQGVMIAALAVAALLMLGPAVHLALSDAEQLLRRLAATGVLPSALAVPHKRLGTLTNSIDVVAAAVVLIAIFGAGRVPWLAGAYAFALAASLAVRAGVLARLRHVLPGPRPFVAKGAVRVGRRQVPIGLLALGATLLGLASWRVAAGDGPWLVAASMVGGAGLLLARQSRARADAEGDADISYEVLGTSAIALRDASARPGNILVAVRHPHALEHVAAALQSASGREVVVATIRLSGIDTDGTGDDATPLPAERTLFSHVVAVVERYGRPVRLLIVPATNVADGLANAVVRLRSSAVYVGESATLSAGTQARLLGDAWERIAKPADLDVRLVIHHRSGRTDTYQLGAHLPSLSPADLDLIHRVWRDATEAIGPHVHHHDVVRAALTHMEQQLKGPGRDEVLASIRETARPAEELAAVIRTRDFTRLRDMVRNRPADDVAEVLTALGLEDQVVAFRVLPRRDAAAVFEYLTRESQEALLKAMAQEDVAALLNEMAPDDRTMFLEELPAAATRQLLTLLTPDERAVAVRLLGYPEGSIGRLMTPNYVAVREEWTIREVLDYVRTHGQDSETLNVIYVVDEHDALIDDIRIREVLLTDPDRRVRELMDRRAVALKATDDQETAVAAFRQHDRTALPVTDTAGMLIGIVTIDDVLDVAEATATREIHRIGGSEALDEPYMKVAFATMIRKRAGWLAALFLGEMLTATAMGFFEEEISRAVVLALFVPLIISSGGNSGSQASTLVIRALALNEVGIADWWRVMRREILAGLVLGGILGSIGFLRITLWSGFSQTYGPHYMLIAITVAVTLVAIVLWGTVVGSLLPIVLRRLGFDPATSSAPFVATLVDVTGLLIYFSVAMIVLRGTLL